MNQANAQATKLIEEARAAAARVQEQETQKAIAAAEQIIAKAREAAALEHARMLAELSREVGRLVVQTTSYGHRQGLDADDQKRLAEETRRQMQLTQASIPVDEMKITKQARREAQATVPQLRGQRLARRKPRAAGRATVVAEEAARLCGHPFAISTAGETGCGSSHGHGKRRCPAPRASRQQFKLI